MHRRSQLALLAVALPACVVVVAAPTSWTPASADPAVVNLLPASFAENSGVTGAVLAECDIQHDLPELVARWSPVPVVLAERHEGAAQVLTLTITQVVAPGGGHWTGPKSMTVHGELQRLGPDGWQTVASFDDQRTTVRGLGTCDMLDVIGDAIGRDIRRWLEDPYMNALLGEL